MPSERTQINKFEIEEDEDQNPVNLCMLVINMQGKIVN